MARVALRFLTSNEISSRRSVSLAEDAGRAELCSIQFNQYDHKIETIFCAGTQTKEGFLLGEEFNQYPKNE